MVILKIGGIKEASTIDYPGEMVSVIFLCNCPFRCPFCQNWSLVKAEDCTDISINEIIKQLLKYRNYITGICVTGGEPTVQIEGLIELLKETHKLGLLNKLDTNGFYVDRINRLLSNKLIDYTALDVKAPFNPKSYGEMIGNPTLGETAVKNIEKTIRLLQEFAIPHEARTTIVPTCNDNEKEIELITTQLNKLNISRYILQQFRSTGGTLDERLSKLPATDYQVLKRLGKIAKKLIADVRIRTIEAGEEKI